MASKYYETDQEAMKKKRAEIGQGKYWEPKEGKNQVRILPPYSKKGVWIFELALHYGFVDDEERKRAYPCLRQWKGEKCPACDAAAELKKVDGGSKAADRMRPRSKYYVNLIDRRVGEDKVFIYGFSGKAMNQIGSYDDDTEDYGDITNPKKGFDIIVEKTGSGLKTRYDIRIKPKSTPAGDFADLYDLEAEIPNDITAREMAEMIQKQYSELLADFDPDEYGKKSKKRKEEDDEDDEPKKKKKKAADDDDDDEPPKKKAKKKVDDDDDDEDDEPPKKKAKKAKKEEDD
jgi:hypothetical protein